MRFAFVAQASTLEFFLASNKNLMDAAFLLTVRSFLLTVELLYLQLTLLASLLTIF